MVMNIVTYTPKRSKSCTFRMRLNQTKKEAMAPASQMATWSPPVDQGMRYIAVNATAKPSTNTNVFLTKLRASNF